MKETQTGTHDYFATMLRQFNIFRFDFNTNRLFNTILLSWKFLALVYFVWILALSHRLIPVHQESYRLRHGDSKLVLKLNLLLIGRTVSPFE